MLSVKKPVSPENRQKTDKRPAPKTAFAPGKSGNPGGRPKKTDAEFELEAACKAKSSEALGVMVGLMTEAKNDSVRLQAALAIIERAHGKPLQRSEVRTGLLDDLPHDELKVLRDAIDTLGAPGAPVTSGAARTTH